MDELRLIKKIQRNGDRAAADELVRYYYDEIYAFVRKQVPESDISLELTQEIFISMLKTIGNYNIKRGTGFRTWLYKIAANKVIDWFRSRSYSKRIKTISLGDVEPVDEKDFIRKFESKDFVEKIYTFLGSVPADTQKIFRLRIFGGCTFSEIAKMEKIPEGSVKFKYYRLINLIV